MRMLVQVRLTGGRAVEFTGRVLNVQVHQLGGGLTVRKNLRAVAHYHWRQWTAYHVYKYKEGSGL